MIPPSCASARRKASLILQEAGMPRPGITGGIQRSHPFKPPGRGCWLNPTIYHRGHTVQKMPAVVRLGILMWRNVTFTFTGTDGISHFIIFSRNQAIFLKQCLSSSQKPVMHSGAGQANKLPCYVERYGEVPISPTPVYNGLSILAQRLSECLVSVSH